MSKNMKIHYDEEGDFLEIVVEKSEKGFFRDIGNDIFERVDEKTNKVVGIAVFNFRKRAELGKDINLQLPFKIEPIAA